MTDTISSSPARHPTDDSIVTYQADLGLLALTDNHANEFRGPYLSCVGHKPDFLNEEQDNAMVGALMAEEHFAFWRALGRKLIGSNPFPDSTLISTDESPLQTMCRALHPAHGQTGHKAAKAR